MQRRIFDEFNMKNPFRYFLVESLDSDELSLLSD